MIALRKFRTRNVPPTHRQSVPDVVRSTSATNTGPSPEKQEKIQMPLNLTANPAAIEQLDPKKLTFNEKVYQKMPALRDDEYAQLLEDVRNEGIKVPVEVTTKGVVVDGHNRVRAAREVGLDTIPAIVKDFESDEDAVAHVFAVNLQRRHLNRTDKQKLIKEYLLLDPYKSNRQIAADLGNAVDNKTVGAMREELEESGQIEEAEVRTGRDGRKAKATKSTAPRKKASKGAGERAKVERERNAVTAFRLTVQEAVRVSTKVENFSAETILTVLKSSPKQKDLLKENLTKAMPIFEALAAHLGIDGYELVEVTAEAEPATTEGSAPEGDDAPF